MEKEKITGILVKVKSGRMSPEAAFERLRRLPYEDLGFAKVDHHRKMRTGFAEVIFCQGKTDGQIVAIFKSLARHNSRVLLTRCQPAAFRKIKKISRNVRYNAAARVACLMPGNDPGKGLVSVVCAGTADIPVAEEAACTAEAMGCRVRRRYDVGVAGVHRLFDCLKELSESACIIAVAGMDGALPSVLGGLVSCPVIAVPTSVGYGANFKGLSALLTMLNSCAPGVVVVNIDNGFGAGYAASVINNRAIPPAGPAKSGTALKINLDGRGKFKRLLATEQSRGMKAGRVRLAPGKSVGEHTTAEREEAIVILEGEATVSIAGKKAFRCPAKHFVYIPAHTAHDITNSGKDVLSYAYIVSPIA